MSKKETVYADLGHGIITPINDHDPKVERIRAFRREASRLAAMANKRIARIEKNGLQSAPAYQGYLYSGGTRFGIKGKDYNQVQAEMGRINKFLKATTSTITGIKDHLKDMAKNTGIQYSNFKDLIAKAPKFFELKSKVEQVLAFIEDKAAVYDSTRIFDAINVTVRDYRIDLTKAGGDLDGMVEAVTAALEEYRKKEIGHAPHVKWGAWTK